MRLRALIIIQDEVAMRTELLLVGRGNHLLLPHLVRLLGVFKARALRILVVRSLLLIRLVLVERRLFPLWRRLDRATLLLAQRLAGTRSHIFSSIFIIDGYLTGGIGARGLGRDAHRILLHGEVSLLTGLKRGSSHLIVHKVDVGVFQVVVHLGRLRILEGLLIWLVQVERLLDTALINGVHRRLLIPVVIARLEFGSRRIYSWMPLVVHDV